MRVLIVDDHAVVRDGVKRIVTEQLGDCEFGDARSSREALDLARESKWDVIVLDITLGENSGIDTLKELKQISPRTPVLILTMHSEEQYARRAFKAGAAGYITKDVSRSELSNALKRVIEG